MTLRVSQIIASIENEAAGPSQSVRRLAEALAHSGARSEILSVGEAVDDMICGVRHRRFGNDFTQIPFLKRLSVSGGLKKAIEQAATEQAVLHSHGLWLLPNVYPGMVATRFGVPLVVSPRGMLGPAALLFSARKKKAFWRVAQRRAAESATCFHATSFQEGEEIRAFGLMQPVAVIPNGIDVPRLENEAPSEISGAKPQKRTVLHLGRIHPKKGIDRLIAAWACVEKLHPDWYLRIVGPSELGHRKALRRQAASLRLERVSFEEALFGADKEAAYRAADLFVLPTLNENFGMVVAEALAQGRPVISTKGAPWEGLVTRRCGWWIDHGPEPLAAALESAMAMPRVTLDEMGLRGREWMIREYSWQRVAADMKRVYLWCLGQGERPDDLML